MSVPRRYPVGFGIVISQEKAKLIADMAASDMTSKAEVARQSIDVFTDPRVSVAAATLGKPVREVLRDAVNEYFAAHPELLPETPTKRGRRRT